MLNWSIKSHTINPIPVSICWTHRAHTTDKHPNPSFIVANMIAKPRSSSLTLPSLSASQYNMFGRSLFHLCATATVYGVSRLHSAPCRCRCLYSYLLFKQIKHNNRINREIVELLINFGCDRRLHRVLLDGVAGGDAARLSRVEIKYETFDEMVV